MALKTKAAAAKAPAPKAAPLKIIPLHIRAEGAKEVVLTGDFTQWAKDQVRLSPIAPGEWTALLELPPGKYEYRLIVDGIWSDHPEATSRVRNPFGSENCVLTVA